MLVDLRKLKPNPMRDFTVDPLDRDRIAELTKSIGEDGFWGGIVCRKIPDGTIQIGAGHHRTEAAIAAGVTIADVFVSEDMDDATMVRVYARENATQRGNVGTAQVGSVASAVRFVAKAAFTDSMPSTVEISTVEIEKHGIGWRAIVKFLEGVPGINSGTVQQALANIKASGDYARIIHEVQEEIERENKEALEALKRAEQEQIEAEERAREAERVRKEAAAKAKAAREEAEKKRAELERQRAEEEAKLAEKRRKEAEEAMKGFDALKKTRDTAAKAVQSSNGKPVTFDFEGVAKHLKNSHQIDVFRQQVTGQGIAPYLAVNKQADLAKHLVQLSMERKEELSGRFINENVTALVLNVKYQERKHNKDEQRKLLERDYIERARSHQRDFSRHCRSVAASALKIKELWEGWPQGLAFPISAEFRNALKSAKSMLDTLNERI